jgi:hypothetical protein
MAQAGYHSAANANEDYNDDDSLRVALTSRNGTREPLAQTPNLGTNRLRLFNTLEWKAAMHPHQRQLWGGVQHNAHHFSEPKSKPQPIDYTIAEENGTSEAFMGFMTYLIAKRFLQHDKVSVMDNAAAHSQGNGTVIKDMLWETIVDGCPLHILVISILIIQS